MPGSLTTVEGVILIGAGAATVAFLVLSLIEGNSAHAIAGLAAYLAVWVYGLVRASYA
jgi:hypothetical protein